MKEFYFVVNGEATYVVASSKEDAFNKLKEENPNSIIIFNREIVHYIP